MRNLSVAPLLVIFVLALAAACSGEDNGKTAALETQVSALQTQVVLPPPAATGEPDRVVSIEVRCDVQTSTASIIDVRGNACYSNNSPPGQRLNVRQLLTVRTALGTTYTVAVAPNFASHLGDEWPPK